MVAIQTSVNKTKYIYIITGTKSVFTPQVRLLPIQPLSYQLIAGKHVTCRIADLSTIASAGDYSQ